MRKRTGKLTRKPKIPKTKGDKMDDQKNLGESTATALGDTAAAVNKAASDAASGAKDS